MKKYWLIGSATLLVMIGVVALAVAQFGGQSAAFAQNGGGGAVEIIAVERIENGEVTAGEVSVSYEESESLPDRQADVSGLFVSSDNGAVTVGTGSIEVEVDVEVTNGQDPVTTIDATYDGDEVTILTTNDTAIYKDTTARPEITNEDIEAGSILVPRTVTPGSLDDLDDNMIIRAWGEWQNGTLTADVLVYDTIR